MDMEEKEGEEGRNIDETWQFFNGGSSRHAHLLIFARANSGGFAINVKSPRPGGYKFRGANKFRARLQGIKVLNGGGIKWMKRNEPHDFSA